jgi:superfamily I DNA/RNA helicase
MSHRGTVSAFNGPPPTVASHADPDQEVAAVSTWLTQRHQEGLAPHEIGLFVRSPAELDRATRAAAGSELPYTLLDDKVATRHGHLSLGTMHLAKGLESRAVVVMACDDEVIPAQSRIDTVGDGSDLEEVYNTERHLLYVACTRARDQLLVCGVEPASEFLDDLRPR